MGDRYWIRILLANVYLDPPTMGAFPLDIEAGDSIRLSTSFPLKYYNHRVGIDLCLTLRVWSLGADSMYREEDSAQLFANNLHCILVAHNRIASVDEVQMMLHTLYPNPATYYFVLDIVNKHEVRQVSVSNSLGEILAVFEPSEYYLINELVNGLYYVTTYFNDGSKTLNKMIKQ